VPFSLFVYCYAVKEMTMEQTDKSDRSYNNSLYPEDQQKVDDFLNRGVNSVPRKPFRPLRLVLLLIVVVTTLSIFSQYLVHWAGIY
tara:strand:+ start:195 stop:452 length:258 start_codon:yes stop_codon:yes gene_type:complete